MAAAIRLLIDKARSAVKPHIRSAGLTWDEAAAMLERIDSREELQQAIEELQQAIDDPATFFANAAGALAPVAKRLLIDKARPFVEPHVLSAGLTWDEAVAMLEQIDSQWWWW